MVSTPNLPLTHPSRRQDPSTLLYIHSLPPVPRRDVHPPAGLRPSSSPLGTSVIPVTPSSLVRPPVYGELPGHTRVAPLGRSQGGRLLGRSHTRLLGVLEFFHRFGTVRLPLSPSPFFSSLDSPQDVVDVVPSPRRRGKGLTSRANLGRVGRPHPLTSPRRVSEVPQQSRTTNGTRQPLVVPTTLL